MKRDGMTIGCIAETRYLNQEMPGAVIRALRERGVAADVLCPERGRFDSHSGVFRTDGGVEVELRRYDLILGRTRNAVGLAMLAHAEAAGLPTINTHDATQAVRNKATMAIALDRAGLPTALTVLASDVAALVDLPAEWFPLILKATYGDNSQQLRLVRRPEELWDVHWQDELVLAQRYVLNDGFDLKLYVCGEEVFAVRKPSPFNGDPRATPHRVEMSPQLRELGRECGRVFGLDLYGVDTIETPDGPVVIEVNEFPNFTGVVGVAERIVDVLVGRVGAAGSVKQRPAVPLARPSHRPVLRRGERVG